MGGKAEGVPVRCDACIIGAGTDGLAAAVTLARAGLRTLVIERDKVCGGRAVTHEFHPGFFASPYADELPPVPPAIFRDLDLARRGVLFLPETAAPVEWDMTMATIREAIVARVFADASAPVSRGWFAKPQSAPWPGESLALRSLCAVADAACGDSQQADRAMTALLARTAADPTLAGTGLFALCAGGDGRVAGGLGNLGRALADAAREAGAEMVFGLEAADIRRVRGRIAGVNLVDGETIDTQVVISTLDLRRTFLSLFAWTDMPPAVRTRILSFRQNGACARLLLALDRMPSGFDADMAHAPFVLPSTRAELCAAHESWCAGIAPRTPPAILRIVSVADPSLAPVGAATATLTLGTVPHTPFDGAWTHHKREAFVAAALARVENALPGFTASVVAHRLLLPPDIESALGCTAGDLLGGDLMADQMLGMRPFADHGGGRTPVVGLYLAGPSSAAGAIAGCAAGVATARAVIADLGR